MLLLSISVLTRQSICTLAGKYSKAPAPKIFPIILSLTKVRSFVRMMSFVLCLSYCVRPFEHALRPSGMSSKAVIRHSVLDVPNHKHVQKRKQGLRHSSSTFLLPLFDDVNWYN